MKYLLYFLFLIASNNCVSQISPPPVPEIACAEIIGITEEMPRFPGCEDQGLNNKELKNCSQTKMLEYIYSNLVYPTISKESSIPGKAVIGFSVEKDGTLANIRIARAKVAGYGQAAVDVIHKMNTDSIVWIPGKQRGRVVVVQYHLPITFETDRK